MGYGAFTGYGFIEWVDAVVLFSFFSIFGCGFVPTGSVFVFVTSNTSLSCFGLCRRGNLLGLYIGLNGSLEG